jgi:hypothetical protein
METGLLKRTGPEVSCWNRVHFLDHYAPDYLKQILALTNGHGLDGLCENGQKRGWKPFKNLPTP